MAESENPSPRQPGRKFKAVVGADDGYEPAAAVLVTALRTMIGRQYNSLKAFHDALQQAAGADPGLRRITYQELSRQLSSRRFPHGPDRHVVLAIARLCGLSDLDEIERLYREARRQQPHAGKHDNVLPADSDQPKAEPVEPLDSKLEVATPRLHFELGGTYGGFDSHSNFEYHEVAEGSGCFVRLLILALLIGLLVCAAYLLRILPF